MAKWPGCRVNLSIVTEPSMATSLSSAQAATHTGKPETHPWCCMDRANDTRMWQEAEVGFEPQPQTTI